MVAVPLLTNSSLSASACLRNCSSRRVSSSGLRALFSASVRGRCIGILALAGHCPWISGSPHGVLGGVYGFAVFDAGAPGLAGVVCAASGNKTSINTAAVARKNRWRMGDLLSLLLAFLLASGVVRIRSAYEQPAPVLERNAAPVCLGIAALGLVAIHDQFRSRFQRPLGESPPQHDIRASALHHPVGDFSVRAYDVDMNPRGGVD